jgi:hypothetical protein
MDEDELELALFQFTNYLSDLDSAFEAYDHYCKELDECLKKPELYNDEVINKCSLQVALNKLRIDRVIEDCKSPKYENRKSLIDILDSASEKRCMDAVSVFNKFELAFYNKTTDEWTYTISFLTRKQADESLMMRQIRIPAEYKREELENALKAKEAAISI